MSYPVRLKYAILVWDIIATGGVFTMKKLPIDELCKVKLRSCGLPDTLLSACAHFQLESGEMVLRQGDPLNWLGIVLTGCAKVYTTTPDGRELSLLRYVSEGLIGDMEFAAGVPTATSTVVAVTRFSYLQLPDRTCKNFLMNHVPFLNLLSAQLAGKLLQSSGNYQSGVLISGEARLCNYVLQNATGDLFAELLTDVSASIGVSYRHLFRLFARLCDEGILKKGESGYRIVNREALAMRAVSLQHGIHSGTAQPFSVSSL